MQSEFLQLWNYNLQDQAPWHWSPSIASCLSTCRCSSISSRSRGLKEASFDTYASGLFAMTSLDDRVPKWTWGKTQPWGLPHRNRAAYELESNVCNGAQLFHKKNRQRSPLPFLVRRFCLVLIPRRRVPTALIEESNAWSSTCFRHPLELVLLAESQVVYQLHALENHLSFRFRQKATDFPLFSSPAKSKPRQELLQFDEKELVLAEMDWQPTRALEVSARQILL